MPRRGLEYHPALSTLPDPGELLARDKKHVWHPYTRHGVEPEPLPIVRAEGARLWLADGRVLVDAISSWWACLHGHGHPRLVEAMARQARELDHVLFAGATHEAAVRLAEELVEVVPKGLKRVFFSDDGSTAVEVALKMAYHAWVVRGEPGRTAFVALEGGYHGDTFGAMALGDPVPFFEPYAPFLFDVERVPPDAERLRETLDRLGARACALVVEPLVQGAAGMRTHPPSFLVEARKLCSERGVFLIADEVLTGFGRTGALFACNQAPITPDFLCLGKAITSGMLPLAATVTSEEIFQAFHRGAPRFFPHGHTFTANPIACAVASASLALCYADDTVVKLRKIGHRIEQSLAPLAGDARVREIRRLGGIVAVELVADPDDAAYASTLSLHLRQAAIERGVLLRPLGSVLYAMPPACTDEEQCAQIAEALLTLVRDDAKSSTSSQARSGSGRVG
jgi:adenosylmethionine-8-amino-7-oxononanoate aminotransferase